VRRYIARNPNTPVSLLEKLAGDKNGDVRDAVAVHYACMFGA